MQYVLIAAGIFGCFVGYNLMLGKASPAWAPTNQTILGGSVIVGSAFSLVIGLATCDIVRVLRGPRRD